MSAPRIAPGTLSEIGLVNDLVARACGWFAGTGRPNLFTTLAKHRPLFRGWLGFASTIMPRGTLPRRETELAILRVAHLRACNYEFEHHARLGKRAGLTERDVERVKAGADDPDWSERERALMRAATMLHAQRDLDDATWTALRNCMTEKECLELVLLVGHYEMLATAIAALRIQLDNP
ncbi:carboxymuconolactone decarboxylase family protein [Pendulispora albinea]|uniref:Carboxymuconolactone decarboxylase family protein n=1 Tax=Pendulispora albinea TaxID=2741071 RepID=A0ABZ2M1G3_9BACT